MCEPRKLVKARHKLNKFVRKYDAGPATCLGPNDSDRNPEKIIKVSRMDVLKCFLREYPCCKQLQGDLSVGVQREFLFDGELWNQDFADGAAA